LVGKEMTRKNRERKESIYVKKKNLHSVLCSVLLYELACGRKTSTLHHAMCMQGLDNHNKRWNKNKEKRAA